MQRLRQLAMALIVTVATTACGGSAGDLGSGSDPTTEATPGGEETTDAGTDESEQAGSWEPTENVEFIIPFGPGGGFDAYSRQVVEAAQEFLPDGVRINVKNVEGAGGAVGAQTLLRAEPDGHTIGLVYDVGLAVSQTLEEDAPINLEEDFEYIAAITEEPYTLFATAASGYTSLEDLQGETIRYGTTGASSAMFVAGVILSNVVGFDTQFVTAYGGAGDLLSGATRGDIDVSALEASSIAQYVETGDLVPLLVLGDEPAPQFPDTPTISEVDGLDSPILSMRPIGAPSGVGDEIVAYWEDVFLQAMQSEQLLAWSEESGRDVSPSTAEETRQRIESVLGLMSNFGDRIREEFAAVGE